MLLGPEAAAHATTGLFHRAAAPFEKFADKQKQWRLRSVLIFNGGDGSRCFRPGGGDGTWRTTLRSPCRPSTTKRNITFNRPHFEVAVSPADSAPGNKERNSNDKRLPCLEG